MYIDGGMLLSAAGVVTALGTVGGAAAAAYKFYLRQKRQDEELLAIRAELQVLCFGMRACLSGLKEQGCDGPVTQALTALDKHLNRQAHTGAAGE